MTRDPKLATQLIANYRMAPLEARQLAILDYAVKLTVAPGTMIEADVIALRNAGFTDRDILDINQVTAYFAYVNRTADGLGVGLETTPDRK